MSNKHKHTEQNNLSTGKKIDEALGEVLRWPCTVGAVVSRGGAVAAAYPEGDAGAARGGAKEPAVPLDPGAVNCR